LAQFARGNFPRSKIEIYLRFFIYRTVTQTRGAPSAQPTVSEVLKQVRLAARGLLWLAKNRKRNFCIVASSGPVSIAEGRLQDDKINYFVSKIDSAKIYIGKPLKDANYDKIKNTETLMPLAVLESFFLPITLLLVVFQIRDFLRIKRRYNITAQDISRLVLKYATKISKSWFLSLLAKSLPVQKVIINDGYAQNIEMVDMGNRLSLETIEVQHGIIAAGHLGYSDTLIDYPSVIPRKLVVWDKSMASQVAWRDKTNISDVARPSPFAFLNLQEKRIINCFMIGGLICRYTLKHGLQLCRLFCNDPYMMFLEETLA
jgi:hypothetical protein